MAAVKHPIMTNSIEISLVLKTGKVPSPALRRSTVKSNIAIKTEIKRNLKKLKSFKE